MMNGTAKVLVADDSSTFLAIVRDLLEADGHLVVTARDGLEAVEVAFRESPDLVVLDVEMPRMDGYQACRMLKLDEQTSSTPVLMLSSRDQPADRYWGLRTGADRYVTKEQPLESVLEAARDLLRERGHLDPHRSGPVSQRPATALDLLSRMNRILDRKLYEATILGEMSRLAALATDLDRTAGEVMALLERLVEFHLACVVVRGERSAPAELVWMVRGSVSPEALDGAERQVLEALGDRCGWVVDPQRVQRTVATRVSAAGAAPGTAGEPGGRFHAIVLGSPDRGAGLFALWTGERTLASTEAQDAMANLASAAYAVLDNARLYQEMARLATTDELTGLANYRRFSETLEREFQRSARTREVLALLMMDLDDFKAINDTCGHVGGDRVLAAVGSVLARNARPYDLVARYGGEEFAMILPATSALAAVEAAERIRLLVRSAALELKMDRLSISVGAAIYPGNGIHDARDLLSRADAALYRAKAEGKDRVCLAAAEP